MPYTPEEIDKLSQVHERIYQRCHNLLYGKATIEVVVRIKGGVNTVRTTTYEVIANSPEVLAAVVITSPSEAGATKDLKTLWARARAVRDIDIFKREVQNRSGGAVTPEMAEQWGELLAAEKYYFKFIDLRAKLMSQAVQSHPSGKV